MKEHTTNYENTFIEVAADCPASAGEKPPVKGDKKTVANIEFDLISKNPYKFTSDDVLFHVYAEKNDLTEAELEGARKQFFSKGQACMRASPLTKRYGWGVHNDEKGRIAVFARESPEYEKFVNDGSLAKVKAMKSSR
ncbi:DUF6157 family protein [Dyadobacter aurulentus]|uniref:DUF6157 family protein n=1 Tax=Dyadobacter sp. UC 10 TaxID=2605428 RepID=UPI0011F3E2B1|nr:DUF6157 family protein [Dyadobacter sp. UC 10]KAA0992972.1 hypothetical protein FXO21_23780 [Dyadobacter sp. UC 10]